MAAVSLAMSISKAAMKLVKAGQAVVSSGGVRLLDGTIFEMAKPMVSSGLKATLGNFALGPVGSGLNIASSLASNVQCAIIQQGVNAANIKLDDVVQRLGRLETAMQGLHSIQVLSWANTALSLSKRFSFIFSFIPSSTLRLWIYSSIVNIFIPLYCRPYIREVNYSPQSSQPAPSLSGTPPGCTAADIRFSPNKS